MTLAQEGPLVRQVNTTATIKNIFLKLVDIFYAMCNFKAISETHGTTKRVIHARHAESLLTTRIARFSEASGRLGHFFIDII